MKYFLLIAALLIAAGCVHEIDETDAGRRVKVIKGDPADHCKEIGDLVVQASRYSNITDTVKFLLREETAALGGDTVRLESITDHGEGTGTAYRCKKKVKKKPAEDDEDDEDDDE